MSLRPNSKTAKHLSSIGVVVLCILAASFARANPYLAKPGEAPVTVYVATCAVSGGFIQLYTALDQNLFEKFGIAIKHVVIRGGTNINLAALGLEVVKLWPSSCYIKHHDTPWYIVCIQAQNPNRPRLSRYQRFTVAVDSANAVRNAHRELTEHRDSWQLRELEVVRESNDAASFLFADLNGNWWEISHASI